MATGPDNDRGPNAADLIPLVYSEVRLAAQRVMRSQPTEHTLLPTDVAHEACLKLLRSGMKWKGRTHFLGTAVIAVSQVLINHAKKKARRPSRSCVNPERAGDSNTAGASDDDLAQVLKLDDAIRHVAATDERRAHILRLRYFGLTEEQIAQEVGVSIATVKRQLRAAKAELESYLRHGE